MNAWRWISSHWRRPGRGISLIVPLSYELDSVRRDTWDWLERFWKAAFPGVEIVIGRDATSSCGEAPFSKSIAINDAVSRSHGDVLIIADADCYIHPETVVKAVSMIRESRKRGRRFWVIPYRRFYRLTADTSRLILRSDPRHPVWPADPPEKSQLDVVNEKSSSHGHWFGALIQIMPREAFTAIGGWDERFRDWGGEDVSMMRAIDTIWARHRTLNAPVWHLWHPTFGSVSSTRKWANGKTGSNDWLSTLYDQAIGDRQKMMNVRMQSHMLHLDKTRRRWWRLFP